MLKMLCSVIPIPATAGDRCSRENDAIFCHSERSENPVNVKTQKRRVRKPMSGREYQTHPPTAFEEIGRWVADSKR
jgi:hypothetical protein